LEELEGKLPEVIEDALTPAAFIESHRAQFHKAQKQLGDRLQQEEIIKQWDSSKALAESAVDEIKSLNDTQVGILRNKAVLEAERDRLLQELNRVNQAIDTADHDLSQIPPAIARLEEEKQKHGRQAYQLHKSLRAIPGSSADNNQVIENIDQIRLHAIKVIREALGLL
jgi:chromosome segregation ATPase